MTENWSEVVCRYLLLHRHFHQAITGLERAYIDTEMGVLWDSFTLDEKLVVGVELHKRAVERSKVTHGI